MAYELSEADVGDQCDELATMLGFEVERYEQPRETMIHEGLPDRRYVHVGFGLRMWVELKKPGGQLSKEQYKWIMDELAAGGLAVCIDDVHTFIPLIRGLMRGGMHVPEVHRRCGEVTNAVAARGYRGVRKSDGLPFGSPKAAPKGGGGYRKPRRYRGGAGGAT